MSLDVTPVDRGSGSACGQHWHARIVGICLNLRFLPGLWSAGLFLASIVCLPSLAPASQTNSVTHEHNMAVRHSPPNPRDIAAEHERAGRKREAAAIYEALARTNTSARKVLALRLVNIYCDIGETNKALTWAREVMRDNPDPRAYLAGVHARLGQLKLAHEILEREIVINTNTVRAVTLRWQLAEVCEKLGDNTEARRILDEALGLAKGTPMEPTARKRLAALNPGAESQKFTP